MPRGPVWLNHKGRAPKGADSLRMEGGAQQRWWSCSKSGRKEFVDEYGWAWTLHRIQVTRIKVSECWVSEESTSLPEQGGTSSAPSETRRSPPSPSSPSRDQEGTASKKRRTTTQGHNPTKAVGGAAGNTICVHNVVAAAATVGLLGKEGLVIRRTLVVFVYYAALAGLLGYAIVWLF